MQLSCREFVAPFLAHNHTSAGTHASFTGTGINRLQRRTGLFLLRRSKFVTLGGQTLGELSAEPNWLTSDSQTRRVIGLNIDAAQSRLTGRGLETA